MNKLIGKDIYLRPLGLSDYESYREVKTRCHKWLSKWEPTFNGIFQYSFSTPAAFASRIEAVKRGIEKDNYYGFGVFLHDSTFIGEVTIGNIERGPFQCAKIGYWIDEKYAGRSYTPQAVMLVLEHAFKSLEFFRIEVAVVPRNKASLRVVEKIGFELEGISKEYIEVNGVREDHNRYAITFAQLLNKI